MRVALLALTLMTVFLVGACIRDDDTGPAEEAVRVRVVEQLGRRQFEAAWGTLHPAHQALVPKDLFVSCAREGAALANPEVTNFDVRNARKETKNIIEIGEVEVVVVEYDWEVNGSFRQSSDDVIKVDGTWRWVVNERALRQFQAGSCPV